MSTTSTPSSASALGGAPATSPSPPVLAKGTASDDRKATRNEALHPHRAPGEAKRSDPNLTARTRGILCEAALFLSRKLSAVSIQLSAFCPPRQLSGLFKTCCRR